MTLVEIENEIEIEIVLNGVQDQHQYLVHQMDGILMITDLHLSFLGLFHNHPIMTETETEIEIENLERGGVGIIKVHHNVHLLLVRLLVGVGKRIIEVTKNDPVIPSNIKKV
jgi:hypothetical protein